MAYVAWRRILRAMLAVQIALVAVVATARDWTEFPPIIRLETAQDIAAIGDPHGDFKRLNHLLAAGGLIESGPDSADDVRWTGGRTHLVCTGDLIDKGHHSLDVIVCLRRLARQADLAGGRVIVTMGNHEAEFLADPDNSKTEDFVRELKDAHIDPDDVAEGSDESGIGEFLGNLPFAVKINDWFFAHACNPQGKTLDNLQRELRESVEEEGFGAKILLGKRGLLESRLKPFPWWEREGDEPAESVARLRGHADGLGVRHFVMGHQPGKARFSDDSCRKAGEMIQKFDGLIFLIDVGMSRAVDHSHGSLLRIRHASAGDTAVSVDSEGHQTPLWP